MQTTISDNENKLEIYNRKIKFKLCIQKSIVFLDIASYKWLKNIKMHNSKRNTKNNNNKNTYQNILKECH